MGVRENPQRAPPRNDPVDRMPQPVTLGGCGFRHALVNEFGHGVSIVSTQRLGAAVSYGVNRKNVLLEELLITNKLAAAVPSC